MQTVQQYVYGTALGLHSSRIW